MTRPPRVAVAPEGVRPWAADAVRAGGGEVVGVDDAEALVWTVAAHAAGSAVGPEDLAALLRAHPGIDWVQLPWAGIEPYTRAGVLDPGRTWTAGKGVYAEPVAEHALALALAGHRHLKGYATARSWTPQAAHSLFDARVAIVGGGAICRSLLSLLAPFRCETVVVRRTPDPLPGAGRVLGFADRDEALVGADVVVLAAALTDETRGMIGSAQLERMEAHAWLVNVARGEHIVTDDLVAGLRDERIGGAALDVTDPEPLPDGHPLWDLPNCLVTPHTANTEAMAVPLLSARIAENVRRYAAGEPLLGVVDPALGY